MEEKRASSFQIRLQNKAILFRVPRLHPDSDWGVAVLFGKISKSNFQQIQPHLQTPFERTANRKTTCVCFQPSQRGLLCCLAQVQVLHAPTNPRATKTLPKLNIWPATTLELVGFCLD